MITALVLSVLAGLSTVLGSLLIFAVKKRKKIHLSIAMGFAAGVMIFISLTELLNQSIAKIGFSLALLAFFIGVFFIHIIDVIIPHSYESEAYKGKCAFRRCAVFMAIGIAIHNLPEGVAVFSSALVDLKIGFTVALAVALHNIPEGVAVALPIYYATKSKAKAFWYSFISGVAEPAGALIAWIFLRNYIHTNALYYILAAVAGIMIYISFDELLPNALKSKNNHLVITGIFAGMAVVALSLALI